MSDITERAQVLAKAHPFGETLENAFLGFFHVIGRAAGYSVKALLFLLFHGWTLVFVIWLAFSDGFRQAAKVQPKQVHADIPEPGTPPAGPGAGSPLVNDPRYADYTTPFGVPFGPNVHASHE